MLSMITILTATYNRANLLPNLFDSLLKQTNHKFQWLVIDDGSTDDTEDYIMSITDAPFEIDYYKKNNGGKHTALNYSHPYIKGDLVFMVDSDDLLTEDAIETAEADWEKYKTDDSLCGLSYRKKTKDGRFLSFELENDYYIDNDIRFRVNKNLTGDRCEILRTDLFVDYLFPEYKGEVFISEGLLFKTLAYKYNFVYINKPLYICEYLDGGLSKRGRQLRMKCPNGMMDSCKAFMVPQVRMAVKFKQMVLLYVYGRFAGLNAIQMQKDIRPKWLFFAALPAGVIVHAVWKHKYMK